MLFEGVGVALATFFREDGEVDLGATAEHAARLAETGMKAVLVAGSTGEASALDPAERLALLDAVRAALPSPGPLVIAGTGTTSSRAARVLTQGAADHGADALLVLSPPLAADPRPYYDEVAKAAGGTPILAYHYPTMSQPGIRVDVLSELPVVGCKDSSGDADRMLAEVETFAGALYVGASSLVLAAGAVGAAGAILALANAVPEDSMAAFRGDAEAQRALGRTQRRVSAGIRSIKELTAERFGTPTAVRFGV